eukprot:3457298-Alexandrium_andersonii.AAC.1
MVGRLPAASAAQLSTSGGSFRGYPELAFRRACKAGQGPQLQNGPTLRPVKSLCLAIRSCGLEPCLVLQRTARLPRMHS